MEPWVSQRTLLNYYTPTFSARLTPDGEATLEVRV
jgi:hypothetical protein